ncbi:MAG: MBL fold metallo-hydrolase [Rhodospirillales bacterium]|nr:MBL fold metallo-hydrolase [Rhodospirillales bacterium]
MDSTLAPEFPKTAPQSESLPEAGTIKEIAEGLYWVQMPLPFALDHINLWLLSEGDGWTLVDTGLHNDRTKDLWRQIFAGPMAGKPLKRLLVTHHHPDHFGLAGWICAETGAELEMSEIEFGFGSWLYHLPDADYTAPLRAHYIRQGMPAETASKLTAHGNTFRGRCGAPPAEAHCLQLGRKIEAGGRTWTVVPGHGHVEAHACLYDEEHGIFIAGDQLLPKISPNVSVPVWKPEADPLTAFIETQERLARTIDDTTLVLPSHGRPFFGGSTRARALVAHHRERLDCAEEACRVRPLSAYDAIPALFNRKLDDHQLFFALGESLSHLNHLAVLGRVQSGEENGVLRFRAT